MLSQRSTRFMANSFDTRYKWQLNYGNKQFFMDETHHCLVLTDNFSIKFNWVHINWEFAVFCQMNTKQSEWIYYFLLLISFCWSHHQPKNMTITFSLSLTHAARTINSSGHSHSMNTCFEVIRCIYSGAFSRQGYFICLGYRTFSSFGVLFSVSNWFGFIFVDSYLVCWFRAKAS